MCFKNKISYAFSFIQRLKERILFLSYYTYIYEIKISGPFNRCMNIKNVL